MRKDKPLCVQLHANKKNEKNQQFDASCRFLKSVSSHRIPTSTPRRSAPEYAVLMWDVLYHVDILTE